MANLLSIVTSGLNTYKNALGVIGNNITNAETPGYTRQLVNLTTTTPTQLGNNFYGTGVKVGSVIRANDDIANENVRDNVALESQYTQYTDYATTISDIMASTDTSMAEGMNKFFNALQQLNQKPESIENRQVFLNSAEVMTTRANQLCTQLQTNVNYINEQIVQDVIQINAITTNIAALNTQLSTIGASGIDNTLLDQRDQLLNQLSKFAAIQSINEPDNTVTVIGANGLSFVVGNTSSTFGTTRSAVDPLLYDISLVSSVSTQIVTDQFAGGALGGLRQLREEVIYPAYNGLGRICMSLASTFNDQHKLGIDLQGNLGENFFNDVNDLAACISRAAGATTNTGTGVLSVAIETIPRPSSGPYQVLAAGSAIAPSGSLSKLDAGGLILNGINIRAPRAGDDLLSPTSDNLSSSISVCAAINASTSAHGITARPSINLVNLGNLTTPGNFPTGALAINGQAIVSTATSSTQLVNDINACTPSTGVAANIDPFNNIILSAQDGRNIQLDHGVVPSNGVLSLFPTNNATALSQVQAGQLSLNSDDPITLGGQETYLLGLQNGSTPPTPTNLTDSDYNINYDGAYYKMTRLSDNVIVAQSATPSFQVDGLNISLVSGTAAINDNFIITPTRNGGTLFEVQVSDPNKIAVASPVRVDTALTNRGSGKLTLDEIINTSGQPVSTPYKYGNAFNASDALTPPVNIVFIDATSYQIFDVSQGAPGIPIGPVQSYDPINGQQVFPLTAVMDNTPPAGSGIVTTYDPGYRVSLSGDMKAQDTFSITFNSDGQGDNSNGVRLGSLETENTMNGGMSTFTQIYGQLIGKLGSLTRKSTSLKDAATSLRQQAEIRQQSISGVNIDEEATALMKFQQIYQACAKLVSVQQTLFDTLFQAFR